MRTNHLLAFGAAAAVIASASIVVGHAASGSASPSRDFTLTVIEHAKTDTLIDVGAPGDSRGDQIAFSNPVFNQTDNTQVGRAAGSCFRTAPGVAWQCAWTLRLAHGSLMVQGPFFDARDSVLAITGGTGDYSKARGSMRLHALDSSGSKYRFTYRVRS